MKKIIVGTQDCMQCKMLSMACPDVEKIEMSQDDILILARQLQIKSLPFVVVTGPIDELQKELQK